MVNINTENDGFAVTPICFKPLGNAVRYRLGSFINDELAVIVSCIVFPVLDLIAVDIDLSFIGPPPF